MKVLHLMLSCFYIDNASYQENLIPRINKQDGHEVLIIASTDVFVKNNTLGSVQPSTYVNEDGIKVVRLPYKRVINNFISKKVRAFKGLTPLMEEFSPEVILFHGCTAYAINEVVSYKKKYPKVKMFIDSHEDHTNSGLNFLSKYFLHRLFYKRILQKNLDYFEKVLYITKETATFLKDSYKVPEEKLKFFPLGGIIPDEDKRGQIRTTIRENLNIDNETILCIHSGKLDYLKRTEEILEAFSATDSKKLKLIIIGSVGEEFKLRLHEFLHDERIKFLGWKKADELQEYLMAADLYIQLGSQSATMPQAICNGCVTAVFPFESHQFLLGDSSFYIKTREELENLLNLVVEKREVLEAKILLSRGLASNILDYKKISQVIFN